MGVLIIYNPPWLSENCTVLDNGEGMATQQRELTAFCIYHELSQLFRRQLYGDPLVTLYCTSEMYALLVRTLKQQQLPTSFCHWTQVNSVTRLNAVIWKITINSYYSPDRLYQCTKCTDPEAITQVFWRSWQAVLEIITSFKGPPEAVPNVGGACFLRGVLVS